MFRLILFAIFLAPSLTHAATLRLKAAEHAEFTRLVIYLPKDITFKHWQTSKGLELEFDQTIKIQDDALFSKLSAGRLSAVNVTSNGKGIHFDLGCDCHAKKHQGKGEFIFFDIQETIRKPKLELPILHNLSNFKTITKSDISKPLNFHNTRLRLLNAVKKASEIQILNKNSNAPKIDLESEKKPSHIHDNVSVIHSLDMGSFSMDPNPPLNANGQECPANDVFDLEKWRSAQPFLQARSALRSNTMKEFDEIDIDVTLSLIKLYLSYGMGPEAKVLFSLPGMDHPQSKLLMNIADIMYYGHVNGENQFSNFLTCNTHAAFWSVLSLRELPKSEPIKSDAIQLAVAALPNDMKPILGAIASERLLNSNYNDLAEIVLRISERSPQARSTHQMLVGSKIDRQSDNNDQALAKLGNIISDYNDLSPQALIEFVDLKAQENEPITTRITEIAQAMAWEHQHSNQAVQLEQSKTIAQLLSAQFDTAFESYTQVEKTTDFSSKLLDLVTQNAPNHIFLQFALFPSDIPIKPKIKNAIASRLIALGFHEQAKNFLITPLIGEIENERTELINKIKIAQKPSERKQKLLALPPNQRWSNDTPRPLALAQSLTDNSQTARDEITKKLAQLFEQTKSQ